ncbi:cell division protein ZapA [Parvularcula marina]|uniref:Cell division protein ZapA n=1 Tax=Parvularcula marina TaxID=2292771 RepID=A0A371RJL2_9PROT|nr:cell division protein ZapA [Parvularcula marina]RFB05642.1 cell division protein ZapA [Parvularcula marina]
MAEVRINVNGQGYSLKVSDGQEDRLRQLAAHFNSHVDRLAEEHGHIAEARLLLLAGLTVCEEYFEAQGTETALAHAALAQDLERAASRIEACAARLSGKADAADA